MTTPQHNAWPLTPALFSPDAITDDTRRVNDEVAAHQASRPHRTLMTVEQERALGPGGGAIPRLARSDRAYTVDIGGVPVRVLPPLGASRGVYVHFHGGGWAFGSAANQDAALTGIADVAGVTCLSVDYRLAPEHVFPAAVDDGVTVLRELLAGRAGVEHHDRVVLGGESAGAHLALLTLLALRDAGEHGAVRGVNLSQGPYDLRLTAAARNRGRGGHVLDTPTLRQHVERFLAGADPDRPDVSPVLAPLHDLPPALMTVGTLDPLLEDTLFLHARWVAAGNDSELLVAPGGIHGFTFLDCAIGRDASRRVERFVAQVVR